MKLKNMIRVLVTILVFLFIFSIPTVSSSALNAEPPPTSVNQQEVPDQLEKAILDAIASNSRYIQGKLVTNLQVTDIKTSQDQLWATAWIVYYDIKIEAVIPSEPAIVIAHNLGDNWQVFLPSDVGWQNSIYQTPDDLLSTSEKDMWVATNQGSVESFPTQSGYLLPWHGGQTASLSRSVGHDADFTTAHYAFDFYIPGNTVCPSGGGSPLGTTGLNFNIYASRAGTVWGWRDDVPNCDHSAVNFIVLRNIDDPTIFQLYMHLAHDSIPPALKSVGASVGRGQFIAIADNTGASTGSHLHFQIEHQPNWPPENPYWRTALDISFDDVDINGGRPRVSPLDPPYCREDDICEVFRQTYVSGNYYMGDSTPPTGELSGVSTGATVSTQTITLSGWGADNHTGLDYGQLVAEFNGAWHNLGEQFNPDFTYTWDFCDPALSVANGPVSVAMRLYDIAGNTAPLVGLRHFTKNYTCPIPPPTCIPVQNQITLFEDPYLHGGCVKFNVGNYPTTDSLGSLGNDDAESILVGDNVIATLYSDENYSGHSQGISQDVGFMQYLWVSSNSLSSMKVSLRSNRPLAPTPVSPTSGTIFRQGDVIPLSWVNGGGAIDYRIEVYLGSTLIRSIYWNSNPVVYVDSLGQGTYSWRVQGRNSAGGGSFSQSLTFTIASPLVIPNAFSVPYTDTMETSQNEWVSTGQWSYKSNENIAHSGSHSWWYQNDYGIYENDQPNYGFLTSPRFSITNSGYYLRFYYRYQTETQGTSWDQRWVQISVDDGPFTNLLQLYDDPQIPETSSWMVNKAIDLSAYTGHIIRIRFQFSSFDAVANNYAGWGIDDFSISNTAPAVCSDDRQDDTYDQAFLLSYSSLLTIPGAICPNGDYDYYMFYGNAGDRIVAEIDAMIDGSPLDSYLFLINSDGQSILAENDDEVYALKRDPLINFTLSEDGVYYLKLRAWKHPLTGGDDYIYSIRLYEDRVNPTTAITWPSSHSYLPDSETTFTANVSDVNRGVNRVEFFWHPVDWLSGGWVNLGTDRDGSNGWSMPFNPTGQPEGNDAAVFIQAYDLAGNWAGKAAWRLGIDKTAPVTSLMPLDTTQPSNAFTIEWTGSDNLSGIDYVQIQEKLNGGSWTTYPSIDESNTEYWIIGEPGNTYSYRMRGVDHSGNSEVYPLVEEAITAIPAVEVLCFAPDNYDTSGNDNSPGTASMIYPDGASQLHNYCNPQSPDFQDDEDWVKMNVVRGKQYLIQSLADSPQTATVISLYAQDGTTLLEESSSSDFGKNTILVWTSERDELVYIRFRHLDGRVIGNDVATTISVRSGNWTYLPVINRR